MVWRRKEGPRAAACYSLMGSLGVFFLFCCLLACTTALVKQGLRTCDHFGSVPAMVGPCRLGMESVKGHRGELERLILDYNLGEALAPKQALCSS